MPKVVRLSILAAILALAWVSVTHADHSLGPKWRGQPVVQVRLIDNSPDTIDPVTGRSWQMDIENAANNWNASTVIHFNREVGTPGGSCIGVQGAVVVCARDAGDGMPPAFTSIIRKGPWIQYVIVTINLFDLERPSRIVACHELGHALGLDHQVFGSLSCLASDNDVPNAHDFEMLIEIY